jgi:UPF0042 nucleotide-binding protein
MNTAEQPGRHVLIVTGMSGAGRSTAANALEDHGWYVVDNLPPQMLRPLIELTADPAHGMSQVACVVDARGGQFFDSARDAILDLADSADVTVVFLDATDDVLVRRFEQVRRPHPLQLDGTISDGIARERELMRPIRERADIVLDTTDLTVHQLGNTVSERVAGRGLPGVSLTLMSFGFKYGLPTDVDMVWDMRFLPNPYWSPELKDLTGLDSAVSDYVLGQERAARYLDAQLVALREVMDGYLSENKRFATLAVGCTGGKHRSVATVEYLEGALAGWSGVRLSVKHRDVGRE